MGPVRLFKAFVSLFRKSSAEAQINEPASLGSSIPSRLPGPDTQKREVAPQPSILSQLPSLEDQKGEIEVEYYISSKIPDSDDQPSHASISTEPPILSKLPSEIIQYISVFLPISSAAAFALSCHAACDILGTQHWVALRTTDQQQERLLFLSLLERDMSGHFACYHCSTLHLDNEISQKNRKGPSARPVDRNGLAPCYEANVLGGVWDYIHEDFSVGVFQMMMKRYRLGLEYDHLLSLLAVEATKATHRFPYQCKLQARIISGSLFLRVQEVILIPSSRTLKIPVTARVAICCHIGRVADGDQAPLPQSAQCTIDHDHTLKRCIRRSGLRNCNSCPTEYEIDLQECGKLGIAVITTKWLDLGEGRTVLDPKWWNRLEARYSAHDMFDGTDEDYKMSQEEMLTKSSGSICALFEEEQDVSTSPLSIDRVNKLAAILY